MNEFSKMQPPQEDDAEQEEQQGRPAEAYQQGLPPLKDEHQEYTPGGYRQYGYQPSSPDPQQYGYQQPHGAPYTGDVGPLERTGLGMKARTAGWLCYLFAWVTGLIFFLLERESRFVRFHAMQSILFFGILGVLEWVFSRLPYFGTIGGALGVVMFIGWIVMMVKAHRGEYYKIPFFGDLAERLIGQIRM